jgi:capsular exopolysaccharide synthesis family protein
LSAQIANAWVREFIDATTDREYSSTAQARGFLEARLNALRSKLEESEQKAVTYASANDIVSLETSRSSDGKTISSRTLTSADLEQLNTALMSARADRISAEARARSGRPDITADALNNQSIGSLKARRAEVASDYAKVLSQFEPGYPQARALKGQIDELDAAIAKDTARFGAERHQKYQEAVARERDLQAQVDKAKAQFDKQNKASIQFNIYQRDADTNRQLYDGLLQRYKEIAEAGSVGASNIAVVDRAEAPNKPSSPKVLVNMALALLAGLGLSVLTVVGLEQIDEGIRGPSDVWKLLKLPLLGNVPLIKGSIDDALMDPKSSLTEAYLSIRSNLAFSTTHGLPRSIAITSSQPAEGKSTTSLAVATIIGRTGKSVVLVDGDLRSPSVHNLAGVGNTGGLSNLLTGDDKFLDYVQASKGRGLSVLPAGPLPPNPAELLSSDRLGIIIEQLLHHFDHVVIDAPPVLGLADAPLICRAVEGSVFVAEPGRSPLRGIRSALQRLKFGGARLFGVIITKIDLDRQHYGYSYGYGYGYGKYGYGYGYSYGESAEPEA